MEHINPPQKLSGTDWQTLGELDVRADSDVEHTIEGWLTNTLNPLELNSDLIQRILRSACDAATHAMHFKDTSLGFGHIHLLAFVPRDHQVKDQTWGFFRLEKLQDPANRQRPPDHSIELYLYIEGQSDLKNETVEKPVS